MDTDASITLSALKFVSGESANVCRLCFASTKNQELSVEDSVKAQSSFLDLTLTIQDMFSELGVSSEPELPQVVCESCAFAAINSYLFKKLCQYSNEKWREALDLLEQSLSETNTLSPSVQTAYIIVKKDENVIFTSRNTNKTKTKSAVISKMKHMIANRSKYLNRVRKIVCEECGIQRSSLKSLIKHMEKHTKIEDVNTFIDEREIGIKQIPCPHCSKLFVSQSQLAIHVERIHAEKKLQCSVCAKMFSSARMLKVHENYYHTATNCKLCFIQFPSKLALRRHMDQHGDNKCPNCNKSFTNRPTYKNHIKICGNPNSKISNFFCDICKKGYVRKNGLRSHLRTDHGFGQVVTCNWCSKKFSAISKLNCHIVKHTRERNFYCEHCGGKFVTQAALKYHIRLHTGERPFPCDLCNETFLSASRRMEHKRRRHFEPTKECKVCHVKFATSSQVKKHEQRHYNPQSKLYVPVFDKKVATITQEDSENTAAIFGLDIH